MAKLDVKYIENFIQSADNGIADDQYRAGLCYSTGDGVQQDLITAHKWFNLAAMNGVDEARESRAEISMDMSSQEIAKAQRLAREWVTGR
ncbi:MAG: hypothetical protein V7723_09880 [Sneathiella sp.]|uniref:hypothetical protein n=1 Tax=Sneathiella sp. TaxID=1964365 RepID=UPI0030019209